MLSCQEAHHSLLKKQKTFNIHLFDRKCDIYAQKKMVMVLFHYYSFDPSSGARPKTARAMSSQQSLGDEEDIANKHICIYNLQVHMFVSQSSKPTYGAP